MNGREEIGSTLHKLSLASSATMAHRLHLPSISILAQSITTVLIKTIIVLNGSHTLIYKNATGHLLRTFLVEMSLFTRCKKLFI